MGKKSKYKKYTMMEVEEEKRTREDRERKAEGRERKGLCRKWSKENE